MLRRSELMLGGSMMMMMMALAGLGRPAVAQSCTDQWLFDPGVESGDQAGLSVAIEGDYLLLGVPLDDFLFDLDAGAVAAYKRVNGQWQPSNPPLFIPNDWIDHDQFGCSIAMDTNSWGTWGIIGARSADVGEENAGAAMVVYYSSQYNEWWINNWIELPNIDPGDNLGYDVAVTGDEVWASAPFRTFGAQFGAGGLFRATVFEDDWGYEYWAFYPYDPYTLPSPQLGDYLGKSLDGDGWFMAAGAPGRNANGLNDSGSVGAWRYQYVFGDWDWGLDIELTPDAADRQAGAQFGASLDLVEMSPGNHTIVVGAPEHNVGLFGADAGAVFVFSHTVPDVYNQELKITSPFGAEADAGFGAQVALYGQDHLVIADKLGRIYKYTADSSNGTPWNYILTGYWEPPVQASEEYAASLAIGADTIAVGDPGHDVGVIPFNQNDVGAAHLLGYSASSGADSCSNALEVTSDTSAGCTSIATPDGATTCGNSTAPDVWYRWTPQCSGPVTIDTLGSDFDTVLSIHSGCPGTAANTLACNDDFDWDLFSSITLDVTAGTTCFIRVSGNGSDSGGYLLTIGECAGASCPADIAPWGGDGAINVDDLLAVISSWGPCSDCPADIAPSSGGGGGGRGDGDGTVNVDDLLAVINAWGACP